MSDNNEHIAGMAMSGPAIDKGDDVQAKAAEQARADRAMRQAIRELNEESNCRHSDYEGGECCTKCTLALVANKNMKLELAQELIAAHENELADLQVSYGREVSTRIAAEETIRALMAELWVLRMAGGAS